MVGKKEEIWYKVHKFTNAEQYEAWRKWATDKFCPPFNKKDLDEIDMKYGMAYKYQKEKGQLQLL